MSHHSWPLRRPRFRFVSAALALVAAVAAFPAIAAADCETVMPTSSVTAGMTGTGWTVSSGTTREPFDVEVIGVLPNAIGPGRDLILVEGSSPAISAAGGIWSGMSGSPVYIGGAFVGVVAYGLSFGPSPIAGLTPASDLVALADLPVTAAIRRLDRAPATVRLPDGLARTVAGRAGISAQDATGLKQLTLPLSVSGLSPRGMQSLTTHLQKQGKSFIPYVGGSVPRVGTGPAPDLEAGDNFAATIAYGDLTIAAVGTASYVCDGRAVAFGHPATFGGAVTLGANAAEALMVVPETLGAPYKLATVGETIGTLDQDRLAGVRSRLGEAPAATPIRSVTQVPELGRSRVGNSEVVPTDWVSSALYYHLYGAFESEFDAVSTGSAALWWVFEGLREDGSAWRLSRGNRLAAFFHLSDEAAFLPAIQLDQLVFNPWEEITVTKVGVSVILETPLRAYRIASVKVSKNRGPFRAVGQVRARPGTGVRLRVTLRSVTPGPNRVVDLPFRIPYNAFPYGYIQVGGPDDELFWEFEEEEEGENEGSFDELLAELETAQRNDVLAGRLMLGFDRPTQRTLRQVRLTSVVLGQRRIRIVPARAGRGG